MSEEIEDLRLEVERLRGELAIALARGEADRIAYEAELAAHRQVVPSPLVYALNARDGRAVRLDMGHLQVSIVLGTERATARPEDVWAAIQELADEG